MRTVCVTLCVADTAVSVIWTSCTMPYASESPESDIEDTEAVEASAIALRTRLRVPRASNACISATPTAAAIRPPAKLPAR